jgi:hypothetical protein
MQKRLTNQTKSALIAGLILIPAWILAQSTGGETKGKVTYTWTDIRELGIRGRGWKDDPHTFNRLPAKAEGMVREAVWGLSKQTAGLYVNFESNATCIKANWKLTQEDLAFPHMAATGVSGLDLYVRKDDGSWHWLGIGKPDSIENTVMLAEGLSESAREYLLYLPLYNGIEFAKIGIPEGYVIEAVSPDPRKPIVFYGTSITQGGCASRPGMCTTAILHRRLNREFINLGFSGNGHMEPEVAALLAELDPIVYFIDCLPNLTADKVTERVEPFVKILRKAHPDTPIVLAEDRNYDDAFLIESKKMRNMESRKALRNAYENLLNSDIRNLYYQIAEGQLGFDGDGTVDSSHPTDLGFYRQAAVYQLILEHIINQNGY